MGIVHQTAWFVAALGVALVVAIELGRWAGRRRIERHGPESLSGVTAIEGAVFAVLGLLVAFTFHAAAGRFDHRRDLILEHANAIGTAWLRLDLLPLEDQPAIRAGMRSYVDLVIELRRPPASAAMMQAKLQDAEALTQDIWTRAVTGAERDGRPHVATLVLPALNQMLDLGVSRLTASRTHAPPVVYFMLFVLAVIAACLAGLSMSATPNRRWFHILVFVFTLCLVVFVIQDLEYPRLGLIRLDGADVVFDELRASMTATDATGTQVPEPRH